MVQEADGCQGAFDSAIAAVKSDGSIVCWMDAGFGGDRAAVREARVVRYVGFAVPAAVISLLYVDLRRGGAAGTGGHNNRQMTCHLRGKSTSTGHCEQSANRSAAHANTCRNPYR